MRQSDVAKERELNGHIFYIRPFFSFTAANLSGEVSSFILPIVSAVLPAVVADDKEDTSFADIGIDVAVPAMTQAAATMSGDRLESLLKKLLTKHGNISVQLVGKESAERLTEDLANNIFVSDVQDMFVLAYDVIRVNFNGFFEKLASLFGERLKDLAEKVKTT